MQGGGTGYKKGVSTYCIERIQDTGKGSVLQGGDIYRIQERCQYGIERIQESCEIAGLGYKIQERGQ